ncbi:hypothetical protein AB733_17110 [Photobacterium swingsii]|nr:hypothetical protein AB733_17110 [Photobacterium swingsii]
MRLNEEAFLLPHYPIFLPPLSTDVKKPRYKPRLKKLSARRWELPEQEGSAEFTRVNEHFDVIIGAPSNEMIGSAVG